MSGETDGRNAMETALALHLQSPPGKGLSDLCGTDPHPEYTCLWRRYRALVRIPAGAHHFSDGVHAAITAGETPKREGTELLRRMLTRAGEHLAKHGFTGSIQELDDDASRDRPVLPGVR
jgi:hypothetical protein